MIALTCRFQGGEVVLGKTESDHSEQCREMGGEACFPWSVNVGNDSHHCSSGTHPSEEAAWQPLPQKALPLDLENRPSSALINSSFSLERKQPHRQKPDLSLSLP